MDDRYKKGKGRYLIGDGVEKGVHDALREATLLIFVQGDDLTPIRGHFGKVKALRKVNEVEDVLLEARAAKAHRGAQKLGPKTSILADSVGDFLNVGAGRLTDGRESIDRRDTLRQHRIGGQFRQLRRPEADSQDALGPV